MTGGTEYHPCGCSEDQLDWQRLTCLEKPKFTCGQLLTDADLTALVNWTERKTALARYRHGWGIVCGLEVCCGRAQEGEVMLEPGYAVSACGQDVIVCAEAAVRLDSCFPPGKPGCADLAPSKDAGAEIEFFGMKIPGVRVVDLSLHYREEGGSPRAMLGRGTCRETSAREYTRTLETFRVDCALAAPEADTAASEAKKWADEYEKCSDVVARYTAEVGAGAGGDIQAWLKRWIERFPPRQFCFLRSWIAETPAATWNEKLAVVALFWIVQDCRNAFLSRACSECEEDAGIPLARLWVQSTPKARCRVLAIDSKPPFRRNLQIDHWPAPPGRLNLGQAIWRRPDDAGALLSRLGLRVKDLEDFELPETADKLSSMLAGGVIVPNDAACKLRILDAAPFGPRVVSIGH
jgi:hypothetical protein